jgi:hypothetical protein
VAQQAMDDGPKCMLGGLLGLLGFRQKRKEHVPITHAVHAGNGRRF